MLFVVTSISEVTSSPPFTIAPPATSRDTPATTVGGETLVYPTPNTPTFPTYAVAAVDVPPEIAIRSKRPPASFSDCITRESPALDALSATILVDSV